MEDSTKMAEKWRKDVSKMRMSW